jgi:hypothetical protein
VTEPNGESQYLEYCRDEQSMDPYVSPLITGSLESFPPMLVQTGSIERLTCEDVAFSLKAQRDGVIVRLEVYNGGAHVFQAGRGKMAKLGMDQIAAFCRTPTTGLIWIKKAPKSTFTMLPFDAKAYIRGEVSRLENLIATGSTLADEARQGKVAPISKAFFPVWTDSSKRRVFQPPKLDIYKDLI